MKKSVFGLDENIAGAISYLLAFLSGIIVLVMEKENKFVRFHALQSTIWFLIVSVLSWMVGLLTGIPILGLLFVFVQWALGIVIFISWLGLMVMAFQNKTFKIPVIGNVVWNQINK